MKGEISLSEVRKDNKGRKLMTGKSQDKEGRYRYKYCDAFENRKSVYSWRLTESDPYPKGKRKDISLREKEKNIQKELNDGINPDGGNMTVLELVEKYINQKGALSITHKQITILLSMSSRKNHSEQNELIR